MTNNAMETHDDILAKTKRYLEKHTLKDSMGENILWCRIYDNGKVSYMIFPPISLTYNSDKSKVIVKCKPSSGFYDNKLLIIFDKNEPIPEYIDIKVPILYVDGKMNIINDAV